MAGDDPEPSEAIPGGGYWLRADLREIEPLPLDRIRDRFPTSRLRFGCFELPTEDAQGQPEEWRRHGPFATNCGTNRARTGCNYRPNGAIERNDRAALTRQNL